MSLRQAEARQQIRYNSTVRYHCRAGYLLLHHVAEDDIKPAYAAQREIPELFPIGRTCLRTSLEPCGVFLKILKLLLGLSLELPEIHLGYLVHLGKLDIRIDDLRSLNAALERRGVHLLHTGVDARLDELLDLLLTLGAEREIRLTDVLSVEISLCDSVTYQIQIVVFHDYITFRIIECFLT